MGCTNSKEGVIDIQKKSDDLVTCFFVLGGPGCGKGTQCANLVRDFGLVHLSAGDLLRAERDSGSEEAELINNIILEGKIVPVAITVELIKKAMKKHGWNQSKFLVDGFPRNEENLEGWKQIMESEVDMKFVLFLECSEENMIARITKRGESQGENKRNDDNLEVLKKRFDTFKEQTLPIVGHYDKTNQVRHIDSNLGPDEVY